MKSIRNNNQSIDKIAIVTLFDNINIGNKLQNYALQKILLKYARSVETLTYTEADKISPDFGWKGRLILKLKLPRYKYLEKKAILERRKKFEEFSNSYIKSCEPRPFNSFGKDISDRYDFFVTGSDQVWHNYTNTTAEFDYFFLTFVERSKRICFAPSFGFNIIQDIFKDEYRERLNGFDVLCCREIQGCEMIKELTGRDVKLISDPTMGLSLNEWSMIEKKPNYNIPEHYILSYFIGPKDENTIISLASFAEVVNLPIIDVFDINYMMYFCTSPDEFVYLISRADYVCTNSFHGTVFSIIFNRRVKLFDRTDKVGRTMNSRIDTIKKEFVLEENEDGIIENFEIANQILNKKRIEIYHYLDYVLIDNKIKDQG